MYKSPIQMIVDKIQTQMIQQEEDQLLTQVQQSLGFNVDKNELLRALNYDRDQYEKGYRDGQSDARWIRVNEKLPKEGEEVLVSGYDTYGKRVIIAKYQGEQYGFTCGLVSAWMPLPEPYRGKENEHN